jgi:hypothetical protein
VWYTDGLHVPVTAHIHSPAFLDIMDKLFVAPSVPLSYPVCIMSTFQVSLRSTPSTRAGTSPDGAASYKPGLGAGEGERDRPRLDRGQDGREDGSAKREDERVQVSILQIKKCEAGVFAPN